jgi:hypothetical protein
MAVLLGALAWLDFRRGGIFLVPPFSATMTILLYLPDVWIAQPFAIVFGSILGAAIGTVLSLFLGFGPGVAMMDGSAHRVDHVAFAASLSSARRGFGNVSSLIASRFVVRHTGCAAIHAGRGGLCRVDEPAAAQLATIILAPSFGRWAAMRIPSAIACKRRNRLPGIGESSGAKLTRTSSTTPRSRGSPHGRSGVATGPWALSAM